MDSMEVNKGIAAVLVAGIAFMGATLLSDALVHPVMLEKPAIAIKGEVSGEQAPEIDPPVAALLASADPKKGEGVTQRLCVSCHTFNQGGKAGVGPNLYGVVGDPHGHMQGFDYSAAIKGKQGPWTFDELYEWLKKPSAYAPGTKMSFAGLANPEQRAEVIAYLNSNSAHPEPLPPPPAAAPAATPAAAGEKATPGAGTPAPGAKAPAAQSAPANAPSAAAKAAPQGQGTATQPAANQNQVQEQQAQGQQPPQATTQTPGPGSAHSKPDESQKQP